MLFSDVMLDLDTGDASYHDTHVKEALGKIKVSTAIFEYAALLAAAPTDEAYVQEAAAEGLPTNSQDASALATASTAKSLGAFYDVVVENAKKVKTAAERDMKALIGLSKKYGVGSADGGSFVTSFALPLARAIVRDYAANRKVGNSIKFRDKIFPDATQSEKMMFAYGNGMSYLAASFGLDISSVIEDPTVREFLSIDQNILKALKAIAVLYVGGDPAAANDPKAGFDKGRGESASFATLYRNLLRGTKHSKFEKGLLTHKSSASVMDVRDIIIYTYVVLQVSKGVVEASKKAGGKNAAMNFINSLCASEASASAGNDKISRNMEKLNANMEGWAQDVSTTADLVVKSFSDAVTALSKVATGEGAEVGA